MEGGDYVPFLFFCVAGQTAVELTDGKPWLGGKAASLPAVATPVPANVVSQFETSPFLLPFSERDDEKDRDQARRSEPIPDHIPSVQRVYD